ncbi:MAG: phosphopantothenoylcysteine decarboxylase, partial [Bacteroidia bacterium]|nr:phosphopantothenoylcysteine decarboxylase [Bacteroidia bacterium]
MLAGKKIIVGITGSIAAYKAALMVRLFVKNGAEVRVVMTEAAKQFVGSLTFSNLSQQPVFSGLWDGNWTEHVHLGAWGDLMVV